MFITRVRTASVGARSGTLMRDRAEAADLVLGRHRASVPGMGLARAAVVDEREALAFGILEIERRAGRRAR